ASAGRLSTHHLFIDLLDPAFGLVGATFPEKIEGLAFGPDLQGGRHVLVVTNDNDFVPTQPNRFLVFAIDRIFPGSHPSSSHGSRGSASIAARPISTERGGAARGARSWRRAHPGASRDDARLACARRMNVSPMWSSPFSDAGPRMAVAPPVRCRRRARRRDRR